MKHSKRLAGAALFVFGLMAVHLTAQVQATNGSIQGEVTDAVGAYVPGAAVEADEVDTETIHRATTGWVGAL